MKINTVIIDDEAHAINTLTKLMTILQPEIDVIATANCVKAGIETIDAEKPELVFLDIRMPDGEGFDVLEKVKFKDFEVIFFTNYDEKDNIMRALKLSAIDFLVKPIDPNELTEAIGRYKKHNNEHSQATQKKEMLIKNIQEPEYLLVFDRWTQKIALNNIVACEADGNFTNIYIDGQNKLMPAKKLKYYTDTLPTNRFVRCHRSYIVNLKFVKGFKKNKSLFILKDNDTKIKEVPISNSYKKKVIEQFQFVNL